MDSKPKLEQVDENALAADLPPLKAELCQPSKRSTIGKYARKYIITGERFP